MALGPLTIANETIVSYGGKMGIHVIAVYKPKPGMAANLEAEVVNHVPLLRRLGLASAKPSLVLRAPDGSVLECFEWVDQSAIDAAHASTDVAEMWGRFSECCDFGTLGGLPNASDMFAEFEFVGSF